MDRSYRFGISINIGKHLRKSPSFLRTAVDAVAMIRDDNGIVLLELIGENDLSKMALYRELNTPDGSWSDIIHNVI